MYKLFIIMILFFSLALSFSNATSGDINAFINKSLAKDPLAGYGIDQPKGKVKKITTFINFEGKEKIYQIFYFDKKGRVYKSEDCFINNIPHGITKYKYPHGSILPSKETRYYDNEFKGSSYYQRDKNGNIVSINGEIKYIYQKKGPGYLVYNDARNVGLGQFLRYYENGLLIEKINFGEIDVFSKKPIGKVVTEFKYEKNKVGIISKKTRTTTDNGKVMSYEYDMFYDSGLISHSFSSNWGNTKYGNSWRWIDYSFDSAGNWISRKRCEVSGGWDDLGECEIQKRAFEYY